LFLSTHIKKNCVKFFALNVLITVTERVMTLMMKTLSSLSV